MKEIKFIRRIDFDVNKANEPVLTYEGKTEPMLSSKIKFVCNIGKFDAILVQEIAIVRESIVKLGRLVGTKSHNLVIAEELWLGHWNDGCYTNKYNVKFVGEVL